MSDAAKFSKIDGTRLLESRPARNTIWPSDVACLLEVPEDGIQYLTQPLLTEVPSFITQVRMYVPVLLDLGASMHGISPH